MIVAGPITFADGLKFEEVRFLLGTTYNAREMAAILRELPVALRTRAFFSAGVAQLEILQAFKKAVTQAASRETGDRTSRTAIREALAEIGYKPAADQAGTIHDLTSTSRLQVMLDTNKDILQGFTQAVKANSNASINDWPAWELYRAEARNVPRGSPSYQGDAGIGWPDRFRQSAQAAGDQAALRVLKETNRMMALVNSATWEHLGSDFEDSLGNPFPPFAWGSGWDVQEISRSEAEAVGLLGSADEVTPRELPDLNAELQKPLGERAAEFADAVANSPLGGYVQVKNGVLMPK